MKICYGLIDYHAIAHSAVARAPKIIVVAHLQREGQQCEAWTKYFYETRYKKLLEEWR